MAIGSFTNLSPYINAQANIAAQAAQPADSLDAAIRAFKMAQVYSPENQQLALLERQLAVKTAQQKLYDMQNPDEAIARQIGKQLQITAALNPDKGLTPTVYNELGVPQVVGNPGALSESQMGVLDARTAAAEAGGVPFVQPTAIAGADEVPVIYGNIPVGQSLNPDIPLAAEDRKYGKDINKIVEQETIRGMFRDKTPSLGNRQFVKNLTNPSDIRLVSIGEDGSPPEGYGFLKTEDKGMKPSEIITAQKEIRNVYDELPSKIDFYGKGQVPGSNQIKTRLDAVLKPVNGDFSKLNPQAKQTFVFAINKLRDPTSATLLAEARQIADKAGIGDRFGAFIETYTQGDPLPDQVAKDIYDVISQVHAVHKENLINSLIPIKDDADLLNKKLTSFGVPKDIQDEVDRRIANPNSSSKMIPVFDPNGNPGELPSDKIDAALKRGFKLQ